jgi:hypothetical protein
MVQHQDNDAMLRADTPDESVARGPWRPREAVNQALARSLLEHLQVDDACPLEGRRGRRTELS